MLGSLNHGIQLKGTHFWFGLFLQSLSLHFFGLSSLCHPHSLCHYPQTPFAAKYRRSGFCIVINILTHWLHKSSHPKCNERTPQRQSQTPSIYHPLSEPRFLFPRRSRKWKAPPKPVWQIALAAASYWPESHLAHRRPILFSSLEDWQPASLPNSF